MKSADNLWIQRLGLVAIVLLLCSAPAFSHGDDDQAMSHDHGSSHHHTADGDHADHWEGSPEGKAYSDFNHHLAGVCVILIGLSEIRFGLTAPVLAWTRFLLPISLVTVGMFLLIWSDHEGWPFGSTFTRTFFTGEWETVQHKWFGILALMIGGIEWLRRTGQLTGRWWTFPLPAFAIVGGLSLFLHSHGAHPSAHKIALHHAVMGVMAITAGSSKLLSDWNTTRASSSNLRWELAWATLVLLIGIQLLIYAE
jgi:putative copper resistance protein D